MLTLAEASAAQDSVPDYEIRYWTDSSDTIVAVSPGWNEFASRNNGVELDTERVIGCKLLSFIQGDVTRMYVRTMIESARLRHEPIVRQYRCDSPELKRFMEMRITLEASGLLCWEHRMLQAETLGRPLAFATLPAGKVRHLVLRCSICNRLKSEQGWLEPDVWSGAGATTGGIITVAYGVCPDCRPRRP